MTLCGSVSRLDCSGSRRSYVGIRIYNGVQQSRDVNVKEISFGYFSHIVSKISISKILLHFPLSIFYGHE